MTARLSYLALALGLALTASACGGSDTAPSAAPDPRFSVGLLPANEVPAITNAEASGTGTATIIFHTTKDGSGNITAATADFSVTLAGFPANTTITAAHIHPGAAGVNGSPAVNLALVAGEIVLTTGGTTFSRNGITVDPALAQTIIGNPAGYYFNVHSTINGGGFARGQLVRSN
jgi:hypothetical protein